jgi:hypothetical protein
MHALKPITSAGIPAALHKAERYRLLNDSSAAESICLDVLEIEPDNQGAIVMLLLAITDQFRDEIASGTLRARELLPRIRDEYKRAYYAGIICERRATSLLSGHSLGAGEAAAEFLRDALGWFEKAEAMRPAGNDEAILRWNTCVRILGRLATGAEQGAREYEPVLDD